MKIQSKRQPVDTLYILGAGASYSLTHRKPRNEGRHRATTPLDSQFLRALLELDPKTTSTTFPI